MIGETFGQNLGVIAAVYLALVLFGIGFNYLTAHAEKTGYIHGYSSIFVTAGVLVTLAGLAVFNVLFALLALGAFAASGTPMVIGSIARYMDERKRHIDQLKQEARDGNSKEEMASRSGLGES